MTVRILIEGCDRNVGAMVKALAVEVAGFQSVAGATKVFLQTHGYYEFAFPSGSHAEEFCLAVRRYLPDLARVATESN